MTQDEAKELGRRVKNALGFSVQPLILAPGGIVRRVLTAFGDPVPDWPEQLRAAGIQCDPEPGVRGGQPEETDP